MMYAREAVDADTETFTITVPDELRSFQAKFHDSYRAACLRETHVRTQYMSVVRLLCFSSTK